MRFAVFGTGGVGGYFGGRLAEAGAEVVFIARGEHLRAMLAHGLKVDSAAGNFVIHPVQATDDPTEVGMVDVVLLGVKAWQVPEAAQAIRPLIGPETFVVPLQNGIEAPSQLVEVLGAEHVIGGTCGLFSSIVGPGHIRHKDWAMIRFGELDNRVSKRVEKLHRAFTQAKGISIVEIAPDIQVALWRKFLVIVALSGVSTVTRAPLNIIFSLPQTRQMLQGVMQEVFNLALAYSITLPEDVVSTTLANLDPANAEYKNQTTSMQRDIMAGRPSELEAQNGAVVRMGQEAGIETPLNSFIYSSLLPMELKSRGQVQFDI